MGPNPAPRGRLHRRDRSPRDHRRRPPLRAALVLGGAAVALAACGSAAASGGTTTTEAKGASSYSAYTACLRQHGVTLPTFSPGSFPTGGTRPSFTPGSGAPGGGRFGALRDNPKYEKAAAACKSLRPTGGFGRFGGGTGGFNSSAFAAYRNCLKLHGVTLPTGRPGSGGSSSTTTIPSSTFQAAEAACAALRPTASTTTTTGVS